MDKVKTIRIKESDGTLTQEIVNIAVDSVNVEMADGENLEKKMSSKVNNFDIINNLASDDSNKPLSAKQGKVLKNEIDKINEEVSFIFPKFMPNQYSGDCNIIRYKNKIIMIDSYSETA